ncbi:MAG TPA: hypothetical protein VK897_15200 [Anaerolineales bacterium]|nr:hypothetical protein [Anaerolineales bacterium]
METTIRCQKESTQDGDLLLLASGILLEVNRIVKCIQMIVAVLLRYAAIGISISDSLIGLMTFTPSEES